MVGVCTRFWRPEKEFSAVCLALGVLAVAGIAYSAFSIFLQRDPQIALDDLLHVTILLWGPEIALYFLLRPLLAPLEDGDVPANLRRPTPPLHNSGRA